MAELRELTSWQYGLFGRIFTSFGALALVLAAVGLYGVMAYTVVQRVHELGVRLALGADPGAVQRLVVRQGLRVALAGAAVGLVAALAATRAMRGLLFGVAPGDPLSFLLVAPLLLLVALLACWLPARRVSRIDPLLALRSE
jgi:putative ABC transport system permease protein